MSLPNRNFLSEDKIESILRPDGILAREHSHRFAFLVA